jgi:hypothetical protein
MLERLAKQREVRGPRFVVLVFCGLMVCGVALLAAHLNVLAAIVIIASLCTFIAYVLHWSMKLHAFRKSDEVLAVAWPASFTRAFRLVFVLGIVMCVVGLVLLLLGRFV